MLRVTVKPPRSGRFARPEESPTYTWYCPSGNTHPFAASSQYDSAWPLRVKRTVVDWPGRSVTFWNPWSCRGGCPAEAGSPRESWATSEPAALPVLVTVADTLSCRLASPLHRQLVAPGFELPFCTWRGVTVRWL